MEEDMQLNLSLDKERETIRVGNIFYPSISIATQEVRKLLAVVGPTESIRQKDESIFFLLLDILKRHPAALDKGFFHINGESMIQDITLVNVSNEVSHLFLGVIIQPFGTNELKTIKISWTKCIRPENNTYYYKLKEAMRYVVQESIEYFSNLYLQNQHLETTLRVCEECELLSSVCLYEIDYFNLLSLLADEYLNTVDISQFPEDFDRCPETYWTIFHQRDVLFRDNWIHFFADHARPRWICSNCIDKRISR
jgi:hypothetical protein